MNTTHRPELHYDGIGINGPDEHRTRVAKFDKQADADKYGPLLAAAPDLLAALDALMLEYSHTGNIGYDAVNTARNAINKAKGIAQ